LKRPSPEKERITFKEEKRLKIFCYKCGQKLDLTEMEPFSKIECPSCSSEIIVPRWFDNYLLEEACGEGGMAKVYRGLDLALDREIAIKILNADIAGEAERGKLFLHEARTAATLNHYALLPIYTCGQFENQPYIVMQFMAGGSLDKELIELKDGDTIPAEKVIKWMHDAAEGLDNARRHGIIHHDIKPGNLMLDGDGALKVGDFGISQALHDSRSEEIAKLTKLWVSPDYVSPEKVTTGKETYLGDVYSLGATFYHILTGHPPFDCDVMEDLLKVKTVRDPVDIRKFRDDIPEALASLIMSMLSRTPEARPSYRDIIAELNSLKKNRSPRAGLKPAAGNGKNPMTATKASMNGKKLRMPAGGLYSKKKSNSKSGTVIMVLFIAALVIAGLYLWKNGYIDQFIGSGGAGSLTEGDFLPDVTERLDAGRPGMAAMLAERAVDSASLDMESKKQGALQLAIALYLNNDKDARNKCNLICDRLISAGVERDDAALSILRYLSAGPINPSNLRGQMTIEEGLKLVSEVAIFVKETYHRGDDSSIRTAHRNFSSSASNFSDKYWGKKSFINRISLWHDWIFTGKGEPSSLEPLMTAYRKDSTPDSSKGTAVSVTPPASDPKPEPDAAGKKHDPSLSLNMLTPEWLQENRKFASSRPKPGDYTFDDTAIQSYLSRLPKEYVKSETMRANQITPLKAHLCATMLHSSYGQTSIKRKTGSPVSGTFMANQKYISVLLASGQRLRLGWGEIHFDQFVKFLDHYAKLRSEAESSGNVSKAKQKREAAWEFLRIAVLCDWYGNYRDAVFYTRKAVSVDSGIENDAIVIMME
jgi:serine/threonine protein kinase/DNA-directed RNA polymerase subunit RPC12/RpoP